MALEKRKNIVLAFSHLKESGKRDSREEEREASPQGRRQDSCLARGWGKALSGGTLGALRTAHALGVSYSPSPPLSPAIPLPQPHPALPHPTPSVLWDLRGRGWGGCGEHRKDTHQSQHALGLLHSPTAAQETHQHHEGTGSNQNINS